MSDYNKKNSGKTLDLNTPLYMISADYRPFSAINCILKIQNQGKKMQKLSNFSFESNFFVIFGWYTRKKFLTIFSDIILCHKKNFSKKPKMTKIFEFKNLQLEQKMEKTVFQCKFTKLIFFCHFWFWWEKYFLTIK